MSDLEGAVLLVEDDAPIRETVTLGLERAGFRVTATGDGGEGLDAARRTPFDLIVLDLMLPSVDGLEVCREIRKNSQVPIVMLTARSDTTDVVVGLEAGADDYVTKPFEIAELVARIRAVLRTASAQRQYSPTRVGNLVIDPASFTVKKGDKDIMLSATEFKLLLELARHPKQVLTREVLLDRVWHYEYVADSRLVDMAIKRLRSKIEDDPGHPKVIETVRGMGYRVSG